jgi:diguanylate cyclase (GGDEF)-like protein
MTELPELLLIRLKACRTLPSIPAVVIEVLDLCEREDIGTSDIAGVLARDPALAAKVLKVSNSAFYGLRSQVTTLERAVSIMGINATLSLSLSFSLVGSLRKATARFDHTYYWRRSIIAAATAKAISGRLRKGTRDEYFLAGLMQDIGILILNEASPENYGRIFSSAGGSHDRLLALERQAFGADHVDVGCWQLERWGLPENLKKAVAASHDPEIALAADKSDHCRAVCVAAHVADIWCSTRTVQATEKARDLAFRLLEMPAGRFETLLNDMADSLPDITSDLELDIGSEESINGLLDTAREALVVLNLQAQQNLRIMQDKTKQDGLTSLYSRSCLQDVLPQYFDAASRTNSPLSAIFIDVDSFKYTNDTYGHQSGDGVLISIAGILRSVMRSSDLFSRYGGDEFVCLLPNTDETGVLMVAERIRRAVAAAPHKTETGVEVPATVSLGCATFSTEHPFETAVKLLDAADRALYAAKRSGRNRVAAADPVVEMQGQEKA